jgi:hypothetical protein
MDRTKYEDTLKPTTRRYQRATRPCWRVAAACCFWTTEAGANRARPTSGR